MKLYKFKFKEGEVLHAEQLNDLYITIAQVAEHFGLKLQRKHTWKKGGVLFAATLNDMICDLESVYQHLKMKPPSWTFKKFREGQVLKASYLNEVVESVNRLCKLTYNFEGP